MAYGYMGKSTLDVVTSVAAVMFLVAAVAASVGPARALAQKQDEARIDGVRNIMEAILELQTVDPERVDELREAAEASGAPPRVMVGSADDCSGDWGVQCGDAVLADHCLDVDPYLSDYLGDAPFDGSDSRYSERQSGYYIDFSPGVLEVGACDPGAQEEIRLERTFF
ncbi:hypothetical protein HYS28_00625 [Candidatus Uhrbacteria bacterium]|nr:hypothetical protein [Candidatus Uhrbacteria bacterium]